MSFESIGANPVIQASKLSKCYQLYNQPKDRLKQFLWRGKRRYYRELWALRDIDFTVAQGEVVGIVGNNGSGKSTLLQLVSGTLTPTGGELSVNGRIAALLELGAGFNPEFTGRENVLMSAAIMGLTQAEIADRFEAIVDFSGIRDFIDQPVKTYSSGMYVRLAFSVAINVDPDILVIDEALSVGDGAFARKSFDRIMQFRKAGKTILFCSHSIYQVAALCDRAIWLDRGRIAMIGSSGDVTNQYGQTLIDTDSHMTRFASSQSAPSRQASDTNNGAARITGVQAAVDGMSGTILQAISQQSTLTIAVQFDFDPALPTPSLVVTFSTTDGLGISSASSYHDAIDLTQYHMQNKKIEVVFPSIPLLKGDYSLSVYLGCENALHCYDAALNIIQLKIEQEGTEQGFVMLPHHWK
ncbi:ABC transporter ATP-binding protein [Nitrosomonas aestuarii]|uniref:ABC transporter ATP-binding protein n=1 Tax=Nitrosomonas aestuarii TaxID=52441 RepID=UPI000D2F568F|nr:ABC transporter ATP-binding protein [Nitrosomonas aestuarii]PTN12105.1 lipopolysaccharide transport system ATP-binding protein [Nitrosomonas aestuarii]